MKVSAEVVPHPPSKSYPDQIVMFLPHLPVTEPSRVWVHRQLPIHVYCLEHGHPQYSSRSPHSLQILWPEALVRLSLWAPCSPRVDVSVILLTVPNSSSLSLSLRQ
jgi:hypothetical protein